MRSDVTVQSSSHNMHPTINAMLIPPSGFGTCCRIELHSRNSHCLTRNTAKYLPRPVCNELNSHEDMLMYHSDILKLVTDYQTKI